MAASQNPVKVGIVGAGFMGQTYAKTIQTLVPGALLAGIAEGSRAPKLADQYGVRYFPSYQELVESSDIGLVCIATPHAQHAQHALAAARAGKHLLIEKPMCASVAECDAVLEMCRTRQLRCATAFTQRRRTGFIKAKQLLDSGVMGRVTHIRTCQIVAGGMDRVPKWQMNPENLGLLFGHGIHNFDAIRALSGQEISSVFAKCRSRSAAPVEGTSDVLITTRDGAAHYLFCSFETQKPGFPRTEMGTRVECERGLLDIDAYQETRASIAGGEWETLAVQPPIDWAGQGFLDPVRLESYARSLQDIIDAIHGNREPEVTGWDGRQAVAAALAAYESSRTGKEVFLT